jgi:hypothetical protein
LVGWFPGSSNLQSIPSSLWMIFGWKHKEDKFTYLVMRPNPESNR